MTTTETAMDSTGLSSITEAVTMAKLTVASGRQVLMPLLKIDNRLVGLADAASHLALA